MKGGEVDDRQFAWATESPTSCSPSVVSGFLTADGKAGPRMKKAARGGAGDSHKVRLALPGNTL